MLKKVTLFLFVGLFAACLCVFAEQAETTQPPAANPPDSTATPAPAQNSHISGVVENVDLQRNTLRVKDATTNASQEILLNESTSLAKSDGTTGTLKELKKGDRVMIDVDSTNTAVKVSLEPAATSPESEKPNN